MNWMPLNILMHIKGGRIALEGNAVSNIVLYKVLIETGVSAHNAISQCVGI